MELVWFTVIAVAIFMIANGILVRIEQRRGSLLKHRSLLFFAIILPLALGSFELLQYMGNPDAMP